MDDELKAAEEFYENAGLDTWTPEELNTLGQLCIRRGRDKALTPEGEPAGGVRASTIVVTGV